jgi:hypothetical protein
MRRLLPALVLALPLAAFAQQPPVLEPIPAPPPPPIGVDDNPDAPGVTLQRGEDVYEEFEVDGQPAIRVTRPDGTVYYLIAAEPGGGLMPGQQSSDTRIRVPQWRVLQW